ncbi:MAG: flagellar brake protein [Acidihalobacter sp.]|uniref:flagellar brake protein n=1 Tax=Acidihalobacter sp. TaxID=1872108 RepID=UPI00307E9939
MIQQSFSKPPDIEPDYQIIQDENRIVHLLDELRRERTLLTALLDGGRHAFSTAIVEIRKKDKALILDEFVPEQGNQMMARSGKLWILGQLHGVKTAFQTDIRDSGIEDGIAFHRISLPHAVRHQQRRESFRAVVSMGIRTPVHIKGDNNAPLNGQLRDLSIGGLSVILPLLKELDDLELGTIVEDCEIDLPGQGQLSVKAEVRHMQRNENQKNAQVGLAFRELRPQDQRLLQRSVTHLEREQLRKQPKDD